MGKIVIQKLKYDVQSGSFDCGNESINRLIQESYFPTLLQYSYAYEVSVSGQVVGYYMIKVKSVKLEKAPSEIREYESSIVHDCCALHISYVAVDKKYQNKKIGTYILKCIVAQTLNICQKFPITIITLDALKDRYDWYKKRGFVAFDENELETMETTIPMYVNCILDKEAVNNYSVV